MDELESRLEHELSVFGRVPLAEPEPVADLRRRARRVRAGRAITGVVAVATAVALVGAVVLTLGNGSHALRPQALRVAAPNFLLGDVDAVVLSSQFDSDGARAPFSPALAATVARVPGVESASGVIDTFAQINDNLPSTIGSDAAAPTPPRTPILFSYHVDDDLHLVSGALPEAAGEIVVDADLSSRNHTDVGDQVSFEIQGQVLTFKIVGTFDLPGVSLTGVPLAAIPAAYQPPELQINRLDVKLAPGASAANVRDAIAIAIGSDYTVADPGVISVPDQRLAQLEIQHAYWALLSPDPSERSTSGVGPPNSQEHANYEKYAGVAQYAELRVENVSFLSPDAASLTYRIYYEGEPSPILNDPQTGTASRVNGHWQLGTSTLCSLAALVGITCKGTANVTITPPNGYQPPSTLDPEITRAFDALADPNATVVQRIAAVLDGEHLEPTITAGVEQDRADAGKTHFMIAGWRTEGANVQILYSVQTTGGPSTPWPSTAEAVRGPDGGWYAPSQYACGISALASEGACGGSSREAAGVLGVTGSPAVGAEPASTPTTATASATSP